MITHLDNVPIRDPKELEKHYGKTAVTLINANTKQLVTLCFNLPPLETTATRPQLNRSGKLYAILVLAVDASDIGPSVEIDRNNHFHATPRHAS